MAKKKLSSTLLWLGVSFWAFFVCYHFYAAVPFPLFEIFHILFSGEFGFPPAHRIFQYIYGLLMALLLYIAAYGVGSWTLDRFIPQDIPVLGRLVLTTAFGFGVLSYSTLALGAVGLLNPSFLMVALAFLFIVVIAWFVNKKKWEVWFEACKEFEKVVMQNWVSKMLTVMLVFVFLTAFVMAFVPEIFYDALVYHLGVPNYYLLEGQLAPLDLLTSKFPLTIQMVYLLGLALEGDIVTKLTHVFFLDLLAGAMLAVGLRFKKPMWGLLSAFVFCSIPMVQMNVWSSGIDIGVALFGFLAVFCFLMAPEFKNDIHPWFILSAVFAGLAASSKYTAGIIAVSILAVSLVLMVLKKKNASVIVRHLGLYALVVGGTLLPWLVKNFAETGNPIYPFLNQVWGNFPIESWRYDVLVDVSKGFVPATLWEFVKILWTLTIEHRNSVGFLGPLLLASVGFLFIYKGSKNESYVQKTVGIVLVFIPLGLYLTRLTRYLLPGMAVISLLLSLGLDSALKHKEKVWRWSAVSLICVCFFLQMSWAYKKIHLAFEPQDALFGRLSPNDYRMRDVYKMRPNPAFSLYRTLKQRLEPTDRVLIFGDEKVYPIKVRHLYSGVYDTNPLVRLSEKAQSGKEVAKELEKMGITHIVINMRECHRLARFGIFNWSERGFEIFDEFWKGYLVEDYVQYVNVGDTYKNGLVLLRFVPEGLKPDQKPVDSLLKTVYLSWKDKK